MKALKPAKTSPEQIVLSVYQITVGVLDHIPAVYHPLIKSTFVFLLGVVWFTDKINGPVQLKGGYNMS